MFTAVHKANVLVVSICALIFLNALPSVARSEDENVQSQETDIAQAETTTTTTTESVVTPIEATPYQTEGIPGGGAVIGDFVVGPGKADLTINPGESKTVEMTVTNRTGERRRFNFTVEDAQSSSDPKKGVDLLGDDRGPYSMKDYVSIPHMSFELAHNDRARIPVTITVPKDAEPGGLYGSVLVDTVAVEAKEGNTGGTVPQSAIVARIGTLFFITVPGGVERDGSLKDFGTIPEKSFFANGPLTLGLLFENSGSIHLAPYGEIRVVNMLGEEVGLVELDPWFVLPNATRLREVTWNREFLLGKYTATANINRSYNDVVDTLSVTFWVLPWQIILGGFATIFVVVFILRAFFKNFEFRRKS